MKITIEGRDDSSFPGKMVIETNDVTPLRVLEILRSRLNIIEINSKPADSVLNDALIQKEPTRFTDLDVTAPVVGSISEDIAHLEDICQTRPEGTPGRFGQPLWTRDGVFGKIVAVLRRLEREKQNVMTWTLPAGGIGWVPQQPPAAPIIIETPPYTPRYPYIGDPPPTNVPRILCAGNTSMTQADGQGDLSHTD